MRVLLAIALFLIFQISHATTCANITKLKEIRLHPGVNSVKDFDVYGRNAKIIVASYPGDTAYQGYDLFLVYFDEKTDQGASTKIVETRGGSASGTTVRGFPFDGEATTRSVRFARGSCDGEPGQVFMLIGTRKFKEGGHYEPLRVDLEVYELMPGRETDSYLHEDWFELVSQSTSKEKFGSADAALQQQFHLPPLPSEAPPIQPKND